MRQNLKKQNQTHINRSKLKIQFILYLLRGLIKRAVVTTPIIAPVTIAERRSTGAYSERLGVPVATIATASCPAL